MADLSTTPVGASGTPQKGMTLSEMMGLAQNAQAYKQAQQINPLAVRQAEAATNVAEQVAPFTISSAQGASRTSQAGAESAEMGVQQKKATAIGNGYVGLINDPLVLEAKKNPNGVDKEKLRQKFESWGKQQAKNAGVDPEKAGALMQPYLDQIANDPANIQNFLIQRHIAGMTGSEISSNVFPASNLVSTGSAAVPVSAGGPLAAVAPGQQLGLGVESQLAPSTPVAGPTGETTYLGPQSQRPSGPVQAGVGPATTNLQSALGSTLGADWTTTSQRAIDAPQRIAIFQNIKKLIPESFTGALSERKQFAANLAQSLGIDYAILEASSTDELSKNTKLLALAGGNTDAARGLAELASPNTKMTKEGMVRVTNQLIGQEQFNSAKANFLKDATGNPTAYQNKLLQWSNAADPRFFQEMSQEEAKKMMSAMSPAELTALRNKKALAKQYGIL